ncbi:MAG: ABC transporter permease [Lachnospiraceae bacterium]|nr:ABC transporter permease [Lachnospiraceae bacterium]
MRKLIWLEWRKYRVGRYVGAAVVLASFLALFVFGMAFFGIADDPATGVPDAAPGMLGISAAVEFLTNCVSFVFTGVLLATVVVGAYRNGTMALMFTYPISRRRILFSKLAAVWLFQFGALAFMKLSVYGCLALGGRVYGGSSFPLDFDLGGGAFYGSLFLGAALVVTVGFLSLFAGLLAKSSKATVVASFVLVFLTQGSVGDLSLAGNSVFFLGLAFLAFLLAAGSVAAAGKRDVAGK